MLGDRPHQKERLREDVRVVRGRPARRRDPGLVRQLAGVRANVDVGIRYLHAWLTGTGAAAIHGLMEDVGHRRDLARAALAVAAPSRCARRWRHRRRCALPELRDELHRALGEEVFNAAELLDELVLSDTFEEFLTLRAYPRLG